MRIIFLLLVILALVFFNLRLLQREAKIVPRISPPKTYADYCVDSLLFRQHMTGISYQNEISEINRGDIEILFISNDGFQIVDNVANKNFNPSYSGKIMIFSSAMSPVVIEFFLQDK